MAHIIRSIHLDPHKLLAFLHDVFSDVECSERHVKVIAIVRQTEALAACAVGILHAIRRADFTAQFR